MITWWIYLVHCQVHTTIFPQGDVSFSVNRHFWRGCDVSSRKVLEVKTLCHNCDFLGKQFFSEPGMWRSKYFVLFEFCGFCTAAQVLVKTTCNIIWKKLQFTTEQRGQKFASDLSYSLFFKQVVIVFCSEYNICCYMFCRTEIIWVHGTTSRCIQRMTPPIRFCKIQTQADKHKHIYSKTNRGRPQQLGFRTRTNQVIQSHVF